ncbi:putative two-component system sensor kinase [[Actinomadura] parvosata subsp. kistnae]|uniref:histidine kinase n=1 Tax=[Actinomadura] parvosata subsp. kistnae TaxID=1909395 RepID=A0A1V0A148_9ACTN|nr:hypothetical protein BKM31_22930 [Nonomuraea sp. ATCC 55076]SPL89789.1 putative two-component system sensor kinase [Actinomadura parvosata subsp. kistnae]
MTTIGGVRDERPGPPLTLRLPAAARAALTWAAVIACVPLLYAVTLAEQESLLPVGLPHLAFAAAMALPLVWARRRPGAVLAVLLAETLAAVVLGQPAERAWPLLPASDLLLCFVTATRPHRTGLLAATATLVAQQAAWHASLLAEGLRVLAPGFLALSALLAAGVAVAWTAGTVLRQRREYGAALRAHAEHQALTAERLRIAREVHDTVAHSIGVIAIQAGAGARVIDSRPDQARAALSAIESTGRQTLQGLRHLLGPLRDPAVTGTGAGGVEAGLADLDRLAATVTAAGVHVEVHRKGHPQVLPPAVDRCAFRVVQESLTNVVRHAAAGHCSIVLDHAPGELRIDITDDGRAPTAPAPSGGYGLVGMRERVALLNGRLAAGPRPEGGWRVTVTLPLAATRVEVR